MAKGKKSNKCHGQNSQYNGQIQEIMAKGKKVNRMVKGKGIIRMQFPPVHHTPPLLGVLQENCATQRLQANFARVLFAPKVE